MKPTEMTGVEYQSFYDCGYMPERFWPEEIARLRDEFADDKIDAQTLDDALDDLMRPPDQRIAQ